MLSLDSVEKSIIELEQKDTTFATCERLAWLYIVRDHLRQYKEDTPDPVALAAAGSDFLQAVDGRNADAVWQIIDEHMQSIKLLYPKEYQKIIQEIEKI